jgi:hypothetical protein
MRLSPIDKRWEQFASAGVQSSVTGFRGSSKPDGASAATPLVVLFRTFFAQLFTSESISSRDQLRQTRQMQRPLAPASQVRRSANALAERIRARRRSAEAFALQRETIRQQEGYGPLSGRSGRRFHPPDRRRRSAGWTLRSRTPAAGALSSVNVLNIWDAAFVKETTC